MGETWIGRTSMLEGRIIKKGRAGEALVRFFLVGTDGDGNASWKEVRAELEIRLADGTPPYPLRGLYTGDKKLVPLVAPGMSLPVKAHPENDDKVAIDWKAWEVAGGAATAEAEGGDVRAKAENAAAYDGARPAPSAPGTSVGASDSASAATATWRDQALEGLDEALRIGNITQAEYDQGKRDIEAMG